MPAASGLAVAVARALLEVVTAADEVEGVAGRGRIGTELEPDKGMLAEEEAFDEEACDDPAEDAAAVVLAAVEAAAEVDATRDEDEGDDDEVEEGADGAAEEEDELLPFTPKPGGLLVIGW